MTTTGGSKAYKSSWYEPWERARERWAWNEGRVLPDVPWWIRTSCCHLQRRLQRERKRVFSVLDCEVSVFCFTHIISLLVFRVCYDTCDVYGGTREGESGGEKVSRGQGVGKAVKWRSRCDIYSFIADSLVFFFFFFSLSFGHFCTLRFVL